MTDPSDLLPSFDPGRCYVCTRPLPHNIPKSTTTLCPKCQGSFGPSLERLKKHKKEYLQDLLLELLDPDE